MTEFQFNPVTPHPLLQPFVSKMYIFQSSGRLPAHDVKLIVPNASFKLTLTCRNGIVARIADEVFTQTENRLTLTGIIDVPVMLDPFDDVPTGTIIIEFHPPAAYRLFRLSYAELKNQIIDLTDLIGVSARQLQVQLADAAALDAKLQLLQAFLIRQLQHAQSDQIFDYCVNRISSSQGLVSVARLQKETGYSARWLHTKFSENLGTGPKNLAEIIRFKHFYQLYASGAHSHSLKEYMYE